MNATYSIYKIESGEFTGQVINVPESERDSNTPNGCGACRGVWDPLRWRYCTESGGPEAKLVGKPDDVSGYLWEWSDEFDKYVAIRTLNGRREDLLALVDHAIAQAESGTDRALRELVIAAGLPLAAVARMQAIEGAVSTLRGVRQQLQDAMTMEQLLAVEMPVLP